MSIATKLWNHLPDQTSFNHTDNINSLVEDRMLSCHPSEQWPHRYRSTSSLLLRPSVLFPLELKDLVTESHWQGSNLPRLDWKSHIPLPSKLEWCNRAQSPPFFQKQAEQAESFCPSYFFQLNNLPLSYFLPFSSQFQPSLGSFHQLTLTAQANWVSVEPSDGARKSTLPCCWILSWLSVCRSLLFQVIGWTKQ